jgi:hypothetical protein
MDADPALVETLRRLEEELLRPEVRRSRAALEARLAPDFFEIGASGRTYNREAIVGALAADETATEPIKVEGFAVRMLAPGVALATYRSVRDEVGGRGSSATTLRSSTWRLDRDGAWRMTFHQGTPAG